MTKRKATFTESLQSNANRKYNLIVFGISECPEGTSRICRAESDFKHVADIFSQLNTGIPESSIRDCIGLGKYKNQPMHPRPILVKLNRPTEVLKLLSLKESLPNGVSFKPDQSKQQRTIESILLKERWKLIQSGTERKVIKICYNTLLVNDIPHGRVHNGKFCLESVQTSTSSPNPATSLSAVPAAVIHSDSTTNHGNTPMASTTLDSVTSRSDASTAATGDKA